MMGKDDFIIIDCVIAIILLKVSIIINKPHRRPVKRLAIELIVLARSEYAPICTHTSQTELDAHKERSRDLQETLDKVCLNFVSLLPYQHKPDEPSNTGMTTRSYSQRIDMARYTCTYDSSTYGRDRVSSATSTSGTRQLYG
jgi:hypothetical protein